MYQLLINIKKWILNQQCLSCKSNNTEPYNYICPNCIPKLILVSDLDLTCPLCHDTWIVNNICQNCLNQAPLWQQLHTIFSYKDQVIKQLFYLYKFKNSILAEADLTAILKLYLEKFKDYHFIVIPCSKNTLQRLGFNPVSKILKNLNIPYSESLYKNNNINLKYLNRRKRKEIENTIIYNSKNIPESKKLILIDDIFTTGTTLNNASKELIKNNILLFDTLCFIRS